MPRSAAAHARACACILVALLAAFAAAAPAASAGVAPRSPISGAAAFRGHDCLLDPTRRGTGLGPIWRRGFPVAARGRVRGMMLFVDFPDARHSTREHTRRIHRLVAPAAVRRLRIASGGKLDLQVGALHSWLRLPGTSASYDTRSGDNQYRLLRDAVRAADRHVDFRNVSFVYVVPAHAGASRQSPAFLAGDADRIVADGRRIWFGMSFGDDALANDARRGSRILEHETGHMFGLLDLYRYRAVGGDYHVDVGSWDPMGNVFSANGYTQWSRWQIGWLPGRQIACLRRGTGRMFVLRPQSMPGGTQLVVVPTSRYTAVAIERRANRGSDAGTCDDGVLVYRVSSKVQSGSGPMRVVPATRAASGDCPRLGHAAFERGEDEQCWIIVDRVRIEVIAQAEHTSTVRVRPSSERIDPRVRSCA